MENCFKGVEPKEFFKCINGHLMEEAMSDENQIKANESKCINCNIC